MTEKILNSLLCPVCSADLSETENKKSLVCGKGTKPHCFDFASSGYMNFEVGKSGVGDSKECVRSRSAFLSAGYYEPISDKLNELADKYFDKCGTVLDAGCGEGYYTLRMASSMPYASFIGADISKPAVEHAAKEARKNGLANTLFTVCSIFGLPIKGSALDGVTCLFAPCPEDEFSRVLKKDGILILVSAGKNHLHGLKKALYNEVHLNDERADSPKNMEIIENATVSYSAVLKTHEDIINLFSMTPYFYRTSVRDKAKLDDLDTLTTEIEVDFSVYRKA